MCCDNPTKLECISTCDRLVLPYVVTDAHVIKTSFLGAAVLCTFSITEDGYALIDKSELNENYSYTFGIYLAGVNVACYQIKIMPSVVCCDSSSNAELIIMDVVTLNSDTFLTEFCGHGNRYAYQCVAAQYNGINLEVGEKEIFAIMNGQTVPVQVAPRDTIPEYTTAEYIYDENIINFLNGLPIGDYITFRPSPLSGHNSYGAEIISDQGFPAAVINSLDYDEIQGHNCYGEGLQMEFPKGATFYFKINVIYMDLFEEIVGHTLEYTEKHYKIDGAKVYPANMRIIPNV